MKSINLRTLDLNLLRMLVTLAETRSVSQAGTQLGLSQPAASNALSRLRQALGDPLFVRTNAGMVPTPFAETILPDVIRHLGGIFEALGFQAQFDPAQSKRTFRLSMSGLGEIVFLPPLVARVMAEAPFVGIRNVPVSVADLPEALESGEVDLAIGMIDVAGRGVRTLALFEETYVAVAGPDFDRNLDGIGDLRNERLVVSAPAASYASDLVDVLTSNGLADNVALQLGNFGALPHLLKSTPLVAIVPRQYAKLLEASGQARLLPVEIAPQQASARLVWSRKNENDPGFMWLRQIMVSLFKESPNQV